MAMKPSSKFGKMSADKPKFNEQFNKEASKAGRKRANEIGGIGLYLAKGLVTNKSPEAAATSDVKKELAPKYRRDALQKLAREKSGKNKPLPVKGSPLR